ncbi:unnamed protein product [Urochloa humidicola]
MAVSCFASRRPQRRQITIGGSQHPRVPWMAADPCAVVPCGTSMGGGPMAEDRWAVAPSMPPAVGRIPDYRNPVRQNSLLIISRHGRSRLHSDGMPPCFSLSTRSSCRAHLGQ